MKTKIARYAMLMLSVLSGCMILQASGRPEIMHDMLLYDLSGPVKRVFIDSESPVANEVKLDFDADGQLTDNMFTHDLEGYVVGFGSKALGRYDDLIVVYDDAGMPSVYIRKSNLMGNQDYVITNNYDGKRLASRDIVRHSKKGDTNVRIVYSGEKYDSHGNWVERLAKQTETAPDGKVKSTEYTETRKIEYR